MLIGSWVRAESGIKLTSVGLSLRVPDGFSPHASETNGLPCTQKLNAVAVVFVVAGAQLISAS